MLNYKQIAITTVLLASTMAGLNMYASNDMTSASTTVSQNFDSMWSNDEAQMSLPEGWRVERNLTAPRVVGTWANATSEVMYIGGTSLASNAKNGTWNFGSSSDQSDRAVGGLSTTVSNGTRCVNVMTCIHNAEESLIINGLNISYNIEKYRKGANTAGFAVQLYYSTDGETWQSAGNSFATAFDPDDTTIGAEVVPISTTSVNDKSLRVHVEAGEDLYLAWNISVASGSTPDKAMGLAVDDISLTASFTDNDDEWSEPETPTKTPSGIYLRGLAGWDATSDWEFSDEGDGVYVLYDKVISGTFKVGDASWSAACNYGSNGTNIIAGVPYQLLKSTSSENISCGANAYTCSRVVLTITDDGATLLLETNDDPTGLTTVYMYGDFNGWNYMDKTGALVLDEADNLFKGRVSLPSVDDDGYSHWMIYQTVGMGGAWGAPDGVDQTGDNREGRLEKKSTAKMSVASGTYDVTFDLNTGDYTMTLVSAAAKEMTLNPENVVLTTTIPETVKVLSLNNSLIYYNDQDAMFNDIAAGMGKDATWTKHTLLGKSLSAHWAEGDGLAEDGNPGAKMMVRSDVWSHIILQEQSLLPRTNPETFRANVKEWVDYIREYCPNPNAVIILPVNWAYNSDWDNFTSFNNTFLANYIDVAREMGVTLCPVVKAYQSVYDQEGATGAATWFLDDRHPTPKATYMAACMEYGLIYGEDPLNIATHPSSITDAEAASMRQYASEALASFSNDIDHIAGSVNFTATVLDEFGMDMNAEDITFTVDGGGSIEGGKFVSDGTVGTFTVTATNGTFTKTATVKVAEPETELVVYPAITLNQDQLTATEDFNSMGAEAEATLPEAWRIDRQTGAPRTLGTYATAVTETTYAGGVNLASNAKNGLWNFGATDDADRAVGGITTGIANGTRAVNIYTHLYNDGKKNLENVTVSYNVEKYRKGNNAAGFSVQLYYSIDGKNWKSAGTDFTTDFAADSETVGYDVVPGETVNVSGVLPEVLGRGCDLYLAWNISVTSGDNCAGAPALAIDDFRIEAQLPEVPQYDYHIYVDNQTSWDALGAYAWGDSELWGAWPGQAPIDEQTIDGVLYQVFGHNSASGSYNLIFNNWNNNKQLADYSISGGRDYYFVITDSSVTEKVSNRVEIVSVSDYDIKIVPNAVTCAGSKGMFLYALSGTVVASGVDSISTAELNKGIYIVRAVTPEGDIVAKIMK